MFLRAFHNTLVFKTRPGLKFLSVRRAFFVPTWKLALSEKEKDLALSEKDKDLMLAEKNMELVKRDLKHLTTEKDLVIEKKDLEVENVKKDLEFERYKNKIAASEVLKKSSVITIRSAVETIALLSSPLPGSTATKLAELYKRDKKEIDRKFKALCVKFNALSYSGTIPLNIYQSLSTHIHGGGYPIACSIKDPTLSPAEWAFVIALFDTKLSRDSFQVYDIDNNLIDLEQVFSDDV